MMYRRRHHRGRTTFLVVLAACWAIGLIGLDGGRTASFRVVMFVGFTSGVVWMVGVVRRASAARVELHHAPPVQSRNCVVIRPLGSDDHPAGRG